MPILNTMSLKEAIEKQDPEAFAAAIDSMVENKAAEMLSTQDAAILADRGHRQLTSEETMYYNRLIDAMRSSDFRAAITGYNVVLPETVIDEVFTDLEENHPLLSHVDLQTVNAKVKILYGVDDGVEATWGSLTGAVAAEVTGKFEEVDVYDMKLSAYLPVPLSMLDLGPAYLDSFVRQVLYNAIARGIEKGILNNLVDNAGPIGMVADLSNGTAQNNVITYAKKTAIEVTEWTPEGLAPVLEKMAKDRNGNPREVDGVFLVVNPGDYFATIKPAICVQAYDGTWVERSPIPVEIIQSKYVTKGSAVIGMDGKYFMGIGTAEAGNIEQSDEAKFLDDTRVYKIKLYGYGRPKDNNAFQLLDISDLKAASLYTVNVQNDIQNNIPTTE